MMHRMKPNACVRTSVHGEGAVFLHVRDARLFAANPVGAEIMNASTRADDWRLPPFRLSNYTNMVRAGWTDGELERFILRDLPRQFHALNRETQKRELERGGSV